MIAMASVLKLTITGSGKHIQAIRAGCRRLSETFGRVICYDVTSSFRQTEKYR